MAIVGSPMYRSDNPRNWDQSVMGWTIAMGWSYFPQSRHWSSKKLLISCFQWSNHGYFSVNLLCLVLKYKNQETRHQCVCYLPRWVAWTCLYKTLLMHQVDSGWVAARHSKTTSLVSKWSTNLGERVRLLRKGAGYRRIGHGQAPRGDIRTKQVPRMSLKYPKVQYMIWASNTPSVFFERKKRFLGLTLRVLSQVAFLSSWNALVVKHEEDMLMEVSYYGGTPKWSKEDHFSIETHGFVDPPICEK